MQSNFLDDFFYRNSSNNEAQKNRRGTSNSNEPTAAPQPRNSKVTERDSTDYTDEDDDDISETATDIYGEGSSRGGADFLVSPCWLQDERLRKGGVEFLSAEEETFWEGLIEKYLHPIEEDKKVIVSDDFLERKKNDFCFNSVKFCSEFLVQSSGTMKYFPFHEIVETLEFFFLQEKTAEGLKNLRDENVFKFFMINALFVLIVFLMQLNKEVLHLEWPLGKKYNISYSQYTKEVSRALNSSVCATLFSKHPRVSKFIIIFLLFVSILTFSFLHDK